MKDYAIHPHWKCLSEHHSPEEMFHFFGPYAGASVSPRFIDDSTIRVEMPLVPTNINIVGTHFGGSLYSMTDPWFMYLLMQKLGEDYIVWDKSAHIDFLRPGKGMVSATFILGDEEVEHVKQLVAEKRKTTRFYDVEVKDEQDNIVARVKKEIYIRRALGKR